MAIEAVVFDIGETLIDGTMMFGVAPAKIAYVGDRVDNDVGPALAAGMVGVHVKRGPWGYLQKPPAAAITIGSLDELPAVLQ